MGWAPRLAAWLGVAVLAMAAAPAQAAAPTKVATNEAPFVRVETGAHEGFVNRLTWLDRGRLLSTSDDQTTRFWIPGRKGAERIVRGQAGPQDQGALYAQAVSDKYVALGGRAGADRSDVFVRLIDRRSGKPSGLLSGLPDAVSALAFSPDGQLLAVGFNQGGVRLYALGEGRPRLERDTRGGAITDLVFLNQTVLLAIEADRGVRRFDLSAGEDLVWSLPQDFKPWRAQISPDGASLAVASRTKAAFALISLADGRTRMVAPAGEPGLWPALTWAGDGQSVVLGGRDARGGVLRRVAIANGAAIGELRTGDVAITALAQGVDAVAYGQADGAIGLWRDGRPPEAVSIPAKLSFRGARDAPLAVSNDGGQVALSHAGRVFALLDLNARRASSIVAAPPGLSTRVPTPAAGLARLKGLEPAEKVLDSAILPDGRWIIGTNFHLRLVGAEGREIWISPLSSPAWGVAASGDGRSIIAALGDGTVVWFNVADGRQRLSAFVTTDLRWAAWTPEGFFDRGPGGGRLIGYQVNRSPREEADFLDLDRMSRFYFRSDLVQNALRGQALDAVQLADASRQAGRPEERLVAAPPPALTLEQVCGVHEASGKITACFAGEGRSELALPWNGLVSGGQIDVTLRVQLRDAAPTGPALIRVNGVVQAPNIVVQPSAQGELRRFRLALPSGEAKIEASVANGNGALQSSPVVLTVSGVPAREGTRHAPTLWILAVGISDYAMGQFDLEPGIASNDAAAIAARLSDPKNRAFALRSATVLKDSQATRANIRIAFDKLVAGAGADDVVIIYLAGHGGQISGDYVFAPYEVGATEAGAAQLRRLEAKQVFNDQVGLAMMASDGFQQSELADYLARLKARRAVLVLDTCFSGSFSRDSLTRRQNVSTAVTERLAQSSGRYVVAAARAFAIDNPETASGPEAHTTFTGAVLRALDGQADRDHDGAVTLSELADYVREDVPKRTAAMGMEQSPVIDFVGDPYFNLTKSQDGGGR